MKKLALLLLRLYGLTRPLRTPSCRFYPSCSRYMIDCIELHGLVKGLMLGAGRLLRCHPLHPGGIDEVPLLQAANHERCRGIRHKLLITRG